MSVDPYARVKRGRWTAFLYFNPEEQIFHFKCRVASVLKKSHEEIRLLSGETPLQDNKTMTELKVNY